MGTLGHDHEDRRRRGDADRSDDPDRGSMENGAATAEDEQHREDRQGAQRDRDPWNEQLAHPSILAASRGPANLGTSTSE